MSAEWRVDRLEANLALVLLAAFLWLVARPYQGIYHDGMLYAAFVARQLEPLAYARDVLFLFGSQDDFSLFASVYALLAGKIGLAGAAKAIVLIGGCLWLAASVLLARTMLGEGWAARLCALYLISASFVYSQNFQTFSVHENFATARSLAIPLATISVTAAFANRPAIAAVLGALAMALHPLFGVWAMIFLVAHRIDGRLLALLMVLVFGVAFAGAGWLPLEPLQVMEPEWEAVVRASSGEVFLGPWGVLRLGEILFWIGVLLLGGTHGRGPWRRACLILALLCSSAVLLAMLCSYVLPVRLVMQVQPWRVMWLAMLFGTAVVCALADQAWRNGVRHFVAFLAIAAFAWSFDNMRPALPYLALAVLSSPRLRLAWDSMLSWLVEHRAIAIVALAAFAASLLPVYFLSLEIAGESVFIPWLQLPAALKGLLSAGGAGLGLALLAAALAIRSARRLILLLVLPGCALAMSAWDARGPAHARLEAAYLGASPDAATRQHPIARGQVVVWPDHPLEIWLVLRAANYAHDLQAVGPVFSAERTKEIQRRLARLSIAAVLDGEGESAVTKARARVRAEILARGGDLRNLHNYGTGAPTAEGIRYLCQDRQLDWVVSRIPRVDGIAGHAVDADSVFQGRYSLHDCRALRAAFPIATARDTNDL